MFSTSTTSEGPTISTLAGLVEGGFTIPGIQVHAPGMIVNVNVGSDIDNHHDLDNPQDSNPDLCVVALDLDILPQYVLAEIGK